MVHGYDLKPKRRLFDLFKGQGLQAHQDVTFLTDGGEEIRSLTERGTSTSEHVLDWFHSAMRLTVLEQCARGATHHNEAEGESLLKTLSSIKWLLWHGNQHRAQQEVKKSERPCGVVGSGLPAPEALTKACPRVRGLHGRMLAA